MRSPFRVTLIGIFGYSNFRLVTVLGSRSSLNLLVCGGCLMRLSPHFLCLPQPLRIFFRWLFATFKNLLRRYEVNREARRCYLLAPPRPTFVGGYPNAFCVRLSLTKIVLGSRSDRLPSTDCSAQSSPFVWIVAHSKPLPFPRMRGRANNPTLPDEGTGYAVLRNHKCR